MATVRRVGMLAPMESELAPLVRRIGLVADGEVHRGRIDDLEVVALLTTMGMPAGARAAERILELGVDWVMVVGIAGGVDRALSVGDVVVPEVTLDRDRGTTHRPTRVDGVAARGTISCGNDLFCDPAGLAELAASGVVAVDMETAAVGAVCERAGVPWSAFRGISDFADEGIVNQELFEATRPDGTADPDAVQRYLEAHPEQIPALAQLAKDAEIATDAAAAAAIAACALLPR